MHKSEVHDIYVRMSTGGMVHTDKIIEVLAALEEVFVKRGCCDSIADLGAPFYDTTMLRAAIADLEDIASELDGE